MKLKKARTFPGFGNIGSFVLYHTGGISMRLKELKINPSTHKLEVDIMEYSNSFVIIVCDGKVKVTELPSHGETKIITHQGKVKRVKFDEGEEF
jgi:hypothetical protein